MMMRIPPGPKTASCQRRCCRLQCGVVGNPQLPIGAEATGLAVLQIAVGNLQQIEISCEFVACSISQPLSSQFFKVTRVSEDKQFWGFHHPLYKIYALHQL